MAYDRWSDGNLEVEAAGSPGHLNAELHRVLRDERRRHRETTRKLQESKALLREAREILGHRDVFISNNTTLANRLIKLVEKLTPKQDEMLSMIRKLVLTFEKQTYSDHSQDVITYAKELLDEH